VISAVAPPIKGEHIHPATRTFQAIRIRVNDELGEIQTLLKSAGSLLRSGGRVALISFHSLEDRLVKDSFRESARLGELEILTKKPVTAGEQEALRNPRSRSAKLRAGARSLELRKGSQREVRKTKKF
jgi:16S rRNA (cytosine1402-N4)-methyltransferase